MAYYKLGSLISVLVLLLGSSVTISTRAAEIPKHYDAVLLNRTSFPPGFIFGTASSSYQVISTLCMSKEAKKIYSIYY